jgi:hypothetical protein
MTLRNQGLTKAFVAGAAISGNRFLKFGTDDKTVVLGAAAGDSIFCVSDDVGCASGERIDVVLTEIATVEFGGTVTRGGLVISDSTGRAIAATATAGSNVRTAGIALASAVVGDKGPVLLVPGSFQG